MSEEKIVPEAVGRVNISDEVVAVVSSVASTEIKGVFGMCNSLGGGIAELFGKKSFSKGVKVEMNENSVKIGVSLTVEFGAKIPDLAWKVQENVKREVENMTGLNVTSVDVFVNGVHFPKAESSEPVAKEEE